MARNVFKIIPITDQDFITTLEALNYEVESRKEIIAFMLGSDYVNSEAFEKYQQQYQDFFIKYQLAKQQLEDTYVKPLNLPGKIEWNLNFGTGELTIYE